MARADLLLALTRAALSGDVERSRSVVEAIAAEEDHKRHTVLAAQLAAELDKRLSSSAPLRPHPAGPIPGEARGFREVMPKMRLDELTLTRRTRRELQQLISEQHRFELLRNHGLEPRHRLLLVGPPGNGKTACAEALATELALPFLVLRYEQIITSYLGETASKLEAVVHDAKRRHCVLFLDEFDVLAKERSDEHEAGEIKRVVSSLLLQLDTLPSHVLLVAATNHAQLLDSAVWRRFQVQLELPDPTPEDRLKFSRRKAAQIQLGISQAALCRIVSKLPLRSFAELEAALLDVRRREVLDGPSWSREASARAVDDVIELYAEVRGRQGVETCGQHGQDQPV